MNIKYTVLWQCPRAEFFLVGTDDGSIFPYTGEGIQIDSKTGESYRTRRSPYLEFGNHEPAYILPPYRTSIEVHHQAMNTLRARPISDLESLTPALYQTDAIRIIRVVFPLNNLEWVIGHFGFDWVVKKWYVSLVEITLRD